MATDYYTQCETRIEAALAELTEYFEHDWQIMTGDESGLVQGGLYFARLHPGGFFPTEAAAGNAYVTWEIELKIYVKFEELQQSWDNFRAFRADVFYKLLQHPSLNGLTGYASIPGIGGVQIAAGENPVYIVDDPEVANPTPLFISQTLAVTVRHKIAITGGEYA